MTKRVKTFRRGTRGLTPRFLNLEFPGAAVTRADAKKAESFVENHVTNDNVWKAVAEVRPFYTAILRAIDAMVRGGEQGLGILWIDNECVNRDVR